MFQSLESNTTNFKILAIQFKYLGDAVFITPALQAIKSQYPKAELHILVADEVSPIFKHLKFINKVWAFPRTRGKAKLTQSLPLVIQLRKEKFDLSIDFVGNDRGSILSLLIGAKIRLSSLEKKPSILQKLAYTKTVKTSLLPTSWVSRHLKMLNLLADIPEKKAAPMMIEADPQLKSEAIKILQGHQVICHLGTSQPKKEWPIRRWAEFYELASNAGYKLAFSAGTNDREQNLLSELKKLAPDAFLLPPLKDLSIFLAVLKQAKMVISGDTGPLHFAAGLRKKIIGLYAVDDGVRHYAPIYRSSEVLIGSPCTCRGELAHFSTCQSPTPCMSSISTEQVFELLKERHPLNASKALK
jgi:ADP-heptose:LPS heptosyltransferase